MRILVACPECRRRYRAEKRKIGTKFHCRCGQVLEVRQPRGHEARVVRCSSCGGARQDNSRNCSFCGSDFTLHERDLNTVCPNCFARVSDRARYCSECGDLLAAEAIAGEDSQAICPACPDEEKLASRQLGHENLNVLECQACTGLWIGVESFRELRDRAARRAAHLEEAALAEAKPRRSAKQAGPLYRPCVVCEKLMARRLYAPQSGVIIDLCKDHGLWFDATELHQVIQWISQGGPAEDAVEAIEKRSRRKPANRSELESPDRPAPAVVIRSSSQRDFLDELVTGIIRGIDRFLS